MRVLDNVQIQIGYKEYYKNNKSLKSLIGSKIDSNVFYLLSLLEYSKINKQEFLKIIRNNYCENDWQPYYLEGNKYILCGDFCIANLYTKMFKENLCITNTNCNVDKQVFDLIIKMNDLDPVFLQKIKKKEQDQFLAGLSIQHYKDNPVAMFKRTNDIFLNSTEMEPYRTLFYQNNGIDFENYIFYIYFLIVYLDKLSSKIKLEDYNKKEFCINIKAISQEFTLDYTILKRIMDCISFTINELRNRKKGKELDLFREKPFFQIENDIYLPVNKKFVNELFYVNVFHRLLNLYPQDNKKERSSFLSNFGKALENYVVSIATNRMNETTFNFYPEMIIKDNDKSPDLLLINYQTKEVIVFEVKAARILKDFIDSYLDTESYVKSIKKQIIVPIKQAFNAVEKMKKINFLNLDNTYSFFFCSITFDSIPIKSPLNEKIQTDCGDLINYINMSIEEFELFIRLITSKNVPLTPYQLLINYISNNTFTSVKNFLSRTEKKFNCKNTMMEYEFLSSQNYYITKIKER